jgi:XTP/dITP diphosphohydrolase
LRRSLLIGLWIRKAGKQEKKMDLLLATHNTHKTREFAQLLRDEFRVGDLSARPDFAPGLENGKTFEENAIAKALAAARQVGGLVVADDSGLEVHALGGAPGIFSARYAGTDANDEENVEKLLRELAALSPAPSRRARFRCVLAIAREGRLVDTVEGTVEGNIAEQPRGEDGFGYDPIFVPAGFDHTFAEMPAQLKNQLSHRARAIVALRARLRQMQPYQPNDSISAEPPL